MQRFTRLYLELDQTTKTSRKVDALRRYFEESSAEDAVWALAFLTGRRSRRPVSWRTLTAWAAAEAALPEWLVKDSYAAVGDLSETLALILPDPADRAAPPPLHLIVRERIEPLASLDDDARRALIVQTWRALNAHERFVFHKLLFGNFRVGAAAKLVTRGLADAAGVDPAVMAHRITGSWEPTVETYRAFISGEAPGEDDTTPYPFFLASPLERPIEDLGDPRQWQIEWKWDGIRAQLIRRASDQIILWSRGDEMINDAFPELIEAARDLPPGTVIDGEVIAWENGRPLPFNLLQRRIGRKQRHIMLFDDVPVVFLAFDAIEWNGEDRRAVRLHERRDSLESILGTCDSDRMILSPILSTQSWGDARDAHTTARDRGTEGLMLKRRDSTYEVGRKRGDWWKWKVDPFTIDAVMIVAQFGSGKRASLFTDYTFGVWDEGELVPITKAYSGLTDEEIREVDRWVRSNATERKGPVRIVRPELVFEIAFEGLQESDRHKSGIALRFPRMARWRRDKRPEDADTLDAVRDLLRARGG